MGQGRGFSAILVLLFCMLVLYSEMAHATTYTVGGSIGGWSFNVTNWTSGKNFKAGDIIVFNYDPTYHNVVIVDEDGYNSCQAPGGSKLYHSGHDQIQVDQGLTYFICISYGHCEAGMKIAVNAMHDVNLDNNLCV